MKPIWPVVGTAVWGLALIPALSMALFSPMVFDAPDSQKDPRNWSYFWSIVSFPILCAVAIVATWVLWAMFRQSGSPVLRALPAIVLMLPLISAIVFAVSAKW